MANPGEEGYALTLSLSPKNSFDDFLLEAVDEALASLGKSCREAVYFTLERAFKIVKCDIPLKIEEFASAIEEIFGIGGKLIEIEIMKRLYAKVGGFRYLPDAGKLTFAEYVTAAKSMCKNSSDKLDNRTKCSRIQNNGFPRI